MFTKEMIDKIEITSIYNEFYTAYALLEEIRKEETMYDYIQEEVDPYTGKEVQHLPPQYPNTPTPQSTQPVQQPQAPQPQQQTQPPQQQTQTSQQQAQPPKQQPNPTTKPVPGSDKKQGLITRLVVAVKKIFAKIGEVLFGTSQEKEIKTVSEFFDRSRGQLPLDQYKEALSNAGVSDDVMDLYVQWYQTGEYPVMVSENAAKVAKQLVTDINSLTTNLRNMSPQDLSQRGPALFEDVNRTAKLFNAELQVKSDQDKKAATGKKREYNDSFHLREYTSKMFKAINQALNNYQDTIIELMGDPNKAQVIEQLTQASSGMLKGLMSSAKDIYNAIQSVDAKKVEEALSSIGFFDIKGGFRRLGASMSDLYNLGYMKKEAENQFREELRKTGKYSEKEIEQLVKRQAKAIEKTYRDSKHDSDADDKPEKPISARKQKKIDRRYQKAAAQADKQSAKSQKFTDKTRRRFMKDSDFDGVDYY